jgi:hypothetical protein
MPESDHTEWKWPQWAGTPEQLAAAGRLAMKKVRALAPYPEGYDPDAPDRSLGMYKAWLDAENAHYVSISVEDKDGYRGPLVDLDALANFPDRSLDAVTSISVTVGAGILTVTIRATRISGLSVAISGYERTWTAGLRHELEGVLKPAWRLRAPLIGDGFAAWFTGCAAFTVIFNGIQVSLAAATDLRSPTRLAIGLGTAVVVLIALAAVWFASSLKLELLGPGEQPRYQRWRGKLLGAIGALILSVIAAAIYGIFG